MDQFKLSTSAGFRGDRVTNYFLVFVESSAEQKATLLVGSDDANKVWVNGKHVHTFRGSRAVGFAQDKIDIQLKTGRNSIVIKVENYNGPGGVSLAIRSTSFLQLRTR